jgi:arylsulfatase A-like enzyme
MYEGGIRVASIVRWPEVVKAGSECATPIISNDYFPTFIEATGAKSPEDQIDGVGLVPLLRGDKIEDRALYWDYPHYGNQGGAPASAVREGSWKLIEWREGDTLELFDLAADPGELKNLVTEHPEIVARLRAKLGKWREDVGAKKPAKNPRYVNSPKG